MCQHHHRCRAPGCAKLTAADNGRKPTAKMEHFDGASDEEASRLWISSVAHGHPPRSGASGPRLPPAAIEKLLHRNMDGACWMGTNPWRRRGTGGALSIRSGMCANRRVVLVRVGQQQLNCRVQSVSPDLRGGACLQVKWHQASVMAAVTHKLTLWWMHSTVSGRSPAVRKMHCPFQIQDARLPQ